MPVTTNKDSKGCYAIWGTKGKKYYYPCGNDTQKKEAEKKAYIQGVAAISAGYKEKK